MTEGNSPLDIDPKPKLKVHEWLAVMAIFAFLGILTSISLLTRNSHTDLSQGTPHHLTPPIFEVLVQGAVEHPGNYQVAPGILVLEVIEQAKPLSTANLKRFKPTSKARNGQVINVPELPTISVEVTGAVLQPSKIKIPKGTKLNELTKYIQLSDDADTSKLQKKRRLSDGDTITIPKSAGMPRFSMEIMPNGSPPESILSVAFVVTL